jgi:hypothetical protein
MKLFFCHYKLMLVILITGACIEPYTPPVSEANVNLLVVDGFVNASNGTATVKITRSLPVESAEVVPSESGSQVSIEDDHGATFPLSENERGVYRGPVSGVSFANQYRLLIRTFDHHEYASDFVSIKQTPPIDSVHYSIEPEGIQLAVTTHDVTGKSVYFRWKYKETYEYNASFNSTLIFVGSEIVGRPFNLSLFTCWKSIPSTAILVSSTERLKQSVVSNFPITLIPPASIKTSRTYSILVEQQTLTAEGYNYWLNVQKSTESLGGLFDPLPSEVKGNVHSTSIPGEMVIGFFGGSTIDSARIFIKPFQLPGNVRGYRDGSNCELDTVDVSDVQEIYGVLLVDGVYAPGAGLIGYTQSRTSCVDCRSKGGNTTKPDFWK